VRSLRVATKQDAAFGHAEIASKSLPLCGLSALVVTDLINGPLNHLPSSAFEADVAWPQSAATAQASTRAVGTLPHPVMPWRAAPPSTPN
jgi:hypothetical protein